MDTPGATSRVFQIASTSAGFGGTRFHRDGYAGTKWSSRWSGQILGMSDDLFAHSQPGEDLGLSGSNQPEAE
jgi:hypothetical protein